jgi:hypothetical protein
MADESEWCYISQAQHIILFFLLWGKGLYSCGLLVTILHFSAFYSALSVFGW